MQELDGQISDRIRSGEIKIHSEGEDEMAEKPRTGDGKKGGRKPTKAECTVRTGNGAVLWKATAAIFGFGKTKKK